MFGFVDHHISERSPTYVPWCSEPEKTEVSRLLHFLKETTAVGGYDYSLNNKIFLGHLF